MNPPSMMVEIVGQKPVPVANLAEASAVWCTYRDRRGLGASNAPEVFVRNADGELFARISYNGRVWPGTRYRAEDPYLYCPAAAAKEARDGGE